MVREALNTWETAVLNEEMSRHGFSGWLRNRDRQPWSLCIPYESAGSWKGCYPDFIVFRHEDNEVVVDIVDPRKAAALAKYAADALRL